MPRLTLPPPVITQDPEPLHQHRRLAILRRVLNDDSLPLRARVAAALVLLYAQPVSRIVRSASPSTTRPPSPLVRAGARFERGLLVERQDQAA
ncbi:hypothetical protein [Streptomyces sp. NPDC002215]|uniref:hypothetical protein n=1 Tax=Streptomyces sp. NPDC002215 TaxID=3154412 RepID=UPI00332DB8FB